MDAVTDDDLDVTETPRTHIQAFLSNVETDPPHVLSSQNTEGGRRLRRSFIKTPVKEAKPQNKAFQRLSTSLPSPGSLITPKSNIQHLLLGTDSAKTPLVGRISSARSTRSQTKSLLHQAPSEWGQKVSISPLYSASPVRNDGESTEHVFKPSKLRRSFRLPDLPPNVTKDKSRDSSKKRDESVLNHSDSEEEPEINQENGEGFNEQSDMDAEYAGPNDNFDELKNSDFSVQKSTLKNASKEMIDVLEQMSKSLQMEKASKIYEFDLMSADDDDSFHQSLLSTTLKPANKSLRDTTLNRTKTPSKSQDSRKDSSDSNLTDSKLKQKSPTLSAKKLRSSHSGTKSSFTKRQETGNEGENVEGRTSPNYSDLFSMKSVEKSVSKVAPNSTKTHNDSESFTNISSTTKNDSSKSKQGSGDKRSFDFEGEQISNADNVFLSSNSKRHKPNNVSEIFDDSHPCSSTPLKRTKSVFSSTKMQASISKYLTPKDSASTGKSAEGFSTIGDLSPIRPEDEHEGNNEFVTADDEDPEQSTTNMSERSKRPKSSISNNFGNEEEKTNNQMFDEEEEDDEIPSGFSPLRTPVIDWSKRPQPLGEQMSQLKATRDKNKHTTKERQGMNRKKPGPSTRKTRATSSNILPRKTVKFYSELYSSMKIDKEALDELETISQMFLANTLETVESYCLHAGRKVINEADFVLLMKVQRLIKNKEDLYDLIREYLPMELRCELIPCFPSKQQ